MSVRLVVSVSVRINQGSSLNLIKRSSSKPAREVNECEVN